MIDGELVCQRERESRHEIPFTYQREKTKNNTHTQQYSDIDHHEEERHGQIITNTDIQQQTSLDTYLQHRHNHRIISTVEKASDSHIMIKMITDTFNNIIFTREIHK